MGFPLGEIMREPIKEQVSIIFKHYRSAVVTVVSFAFFIGMVVGYVVG